MLSCKIENIFRRIQIIFPGSWDGWEVDVGGGQWVEDASLVTACHVGDEAATTNYPPISTTSDQV